MIGDFGMLKFIIKVLLAGWAAYLYQLGVKKRVKDEEVGCFPFVLLIVAVII